MVPVRITEEVKTHLFYIILHNLCFHDGDMEMDESSKSGRRRFPREFQYVPPWLHE